MAFSARRNSARSLPNLGLTFVRWSFARGASWRGYWLLASLYLVVVADLTASQLVLIGAGQAATVLLAELPAGVFADTVSRRRSLLIAHVVTGAGMIMLGLVASFPALVLSQALCGLGWAFSSGADVAWITDELDDQRVISRVLAARARWELSGAVAGIVVLGCFAFVTDLRTGIVVSGLTMLALAGVVALRFPEEHFSPADPGRRWQEGLSLLGNAVRLARGDRVLLLLSSAWFLVNGSGEAYGRLVDKRLIDLGFGAGDQPVVWFIALGLVTLMLGFSVLSVLEHRVGDEDVTRRSYIGCCAAGVVGLALFASAPDARFAIAGVLLTTGCAHPGAVVRALTEISVNQRTTSAVRATVHSLFSLAEHVGEIVLGLVLATLAGATSLTASVVGSAALLALAGGLVSRTRSRPDVD
jgi:MFS family permease